MRVPDASARIVRCEPVQTVNLPGIFDRLERIPRSHRSAVRWEDDDEHSGGRNRWVAGILGVLLGPFGVHQFYLGYTGTGVLQIIATFCTFGFACLWGIVEGVLILVGMRFRDADGLPLRE